MDQSILRPSPGGDEFERYLEKNGVFEALESTVDWLYKEGVAPDEDLSAFPLFVDKLASNLSKNPKNELKTLHTEQNELQQELEKLVKEESVLKKRVTSLQVGSGSGSGSETETETENERKSAEDEEEENPAPLSESESEAEDENSTY